MAVVARPDELYFSVPSVGPKVYITKGPSGWTETFSRIKADADLANLIAPYTIGDMVDLFLLNRELKRTPTDWYTVTGFLGRMTNVSPKTIPPQAAVALWGHVVLYSTHGRFN